MRTPVALALGAAAAWSLPAPAAHAPQLCSLLGIPRRSDTAAGAVVLTFDDGPHPEGTPAILEALARDGAHATFFLVGEQVERRPALAAEIVAAGHEVALHGHRHRNLLRVPPSVARDDLDRGAEAIAAATGRSPSLYRPPYGIFSWPALQHARSRGWQPLLWSRWGRDWRASATAAGIAALAGDHAEPGDVVLLHDADFYSAEGSHRRTAAAMPLLLETLERHGLGAVAA
jgi:peptidoglycan/xylan/chitin deacetylase (PgdA/CDA1 family)